MNWLFSFGLAGRVRDLIFRIVERVGLKSIALWLIASQQNYFFSKVMNFFVGFRSGCRLSSNRIFGFNGFPSIYIYIYVQTKWFHFVVSMFQNNNSMLLVHFRVFLTSVVSLSSPVYTSNPITIISNQFH